LAFAAVSPGLVISPVAGALLDRIGAARAIAVDMIASAIVIAALVLADRLGGADVPGVTVLVALFSLTSPLTLTACTSSAGEFSLSRSSRRRVLPPKPAIWSPVCCGPPSAWRAASVLSLPAGSALRDGNGGS
jgi:hypothetical protein